MWARPAGEDRWRRVQFGLAIFGLILAVGTIGYMALGLDPFEAFYQTAITVTTVGYSEVGAEQLANDTAYRVWTLLLVLFGTGSALYTVGVLVESLVEEGLDDRLRRRRMQNDVDELEGHVIVAGWGRVGHAIAAYAGRQGTPVVVIDHEPQVETSMIPIIEGDATDDEVLLRAGLLRARTLVAALDSDAKNLYVTLSARALAPDLLIVARTTNQAVEPKFFQAGADRVVNPHDIGGSRMGALALQPHVAEFLDEVLHDETQDAQVLELRVDESGGAVGEQLADLGGADANQALVIAVRHASGRFHANPKPDHRLDGGDVLIAIGSNAELSALAARVGDLGAVADLPAG